MKFKSASYNIGPPFKPIEAFLLIGESTNSHKSCFYNVLTITSEIIIGGWFVACLLLHLDTFRGRSVTLRSLIYLTCLYIFFSAINLPHVVMERLLVLQCCKRYEKKKIRITTYRASSTFPHLKPVFLAQVLRITRAFMSDIISTRQSHILFQRKV